LRAADFGAGLATGFAAGLALAADFVAALPRAAAAGFVFLAAGFFDFFRALEADEDLDFLGCDFLDGDLDAALAMASKRHKEGEILPALHHVLQHSRKPRGPFQAQPTGLSTAIRHRSQSICGAVR
jgi:hypothetical protein